MSTDYFAHAAYGVIVEGDALQALEEGFNKAMMELEDTDEFDDLYASERSDAAMTRFLEQDAEGYARVMELAGVPRDANLIWTGGQDERPGRCHTQPETWIAGYGVLSFPRKVDKTKFKTEPEWFFWVTVP
jgi:hypothetical protein